jgi:hypothetical protein
MSVYQPGDFIWSRYDGEWYEAEIEEVEPGGTYRVYYHEYDDSVPGQPLYLIKDYEEGETEPPPDGPNQANAPEEEEYAEEEYTEEEEYVEEYVEEEAPAEEEVPSPAEPETNDEPNEAVIEDDGAARLAAKRAAMEKAARDKKAAEAKARADARAPTKPVASKQFEAAKQAERRKSQKRDELDKEFSFAPQLATRRGSGSQSRSSNRTSALYEHGKSKGRTSGSFSSEPEPAKPTTTKKVSKSDRTNRLYEAGKAREMARLQKEDAEKEIQARSSSSSSYDARMGFDKSKTGLGQDLVTTGARTNALYQEAQMREQKKKQLKAQKEKQDSEATFKPKLYTRNKTKSSTNVVSRLYNDGISKNKKLERKREEEAWSEEMTFQPDISASQRFCESSSLPGARHEALFMQGEIQRMRREEMYDNFVDGKEVDDLTFTPAVNYRYNDELLGADTSDFSERLYKTDFTGSLAREEEMDEYKDHQYEECTFEPELIARRNDDDENEERESRSEKLYKDALAIQKKKQEMQDEAARRDAERKLKLKARKNMEDDDDTTTPAHDRLYSSHKKSLENKEKQAKAPVKASFTPKFFSSKKTREEGAKRATEDLYKAGVDKLAATRLAEKEKKPHHIVAAEEEAAKHPFKPQLATKKKKSSLSLRNSVELEVDDGAMNPMMRNSSMDSVSSNMSDMSVSSTSSARKGSAFGTGNIKKDKAAAIRSERSSALQTKAAELLAKRQAAKAAQS